MDFSESGRIVNIGVVGLGGRGYGWLELLCEMDDVRVVAVCDVYADRVERACARVKEMRGIDAFGTPDYNELVRRDDVEAVLVFSSWETHIRVAVAAMEAGKRPAMEVGGASSLDECWQLVRASERTGVPCMLLENCCYGREEMTVLDMVHAGMFGELVHCEGGYQHDLRSEIGNGDVNRHYRQRHFMHRNGELYPTHELGPIATLLDINHGNRMISLTATASKAAGLHAWYEKNRADTDLPKQPVAEGDVVTTVIRCARGETIVLTHDCTTPRPYSRGARVQGAKGIYMEDKYGYYLEDLPECEEHAWTDFKVALEKYENPVWKEFRVSGKKGGHGGMDYLVMRAFIESVQCHGEPPIDVYDAAAWMAITCLSEDSITKGSAPVTIPDFTDGRYLERTGGAQGQYRLFR